MKKLIVLALFLTACPDEKVGLAYYCPKICKRGAECVLIPNDQVDACINKCTSTPLEKRYSDKDVKDITDQITALDCSMFLHLLMDK